MSDALNEYDYWFVIPTDVLGNITQPQSEYIQRFRTYQNALDCAATDEDEPCAVIPGWMWFNIEHTCPYCRGTGKEVYQTLHTVDQCSFCKGTGRKS